MNYITTNHLQREIRRVDGLDVVLFYGDTPLNADHGDYVDAHYDSWSRAAPQKMSVGNWISKRFHKKFPELGITVLDANGAALENHVPLSTARCLSPNIPITLEYFHWNSKHLYETKDEDSGLRLKSELIEAGFKAKYLRVGTFFKTFYVVAEPPGIAVLTHELRPIFEYFDAIINKHTAKRYNTSFLEWWKYNEEAE